jgi:hypothetical protein
MDVFLYLVAGYMLTVRNNICLFYIKKEKTQYARSLSLSKGALAVGFGTLRVSQRYRNSLT